jgi:hypothetical protein
VSGWWGSHNLDQRLFADGADAAMLGLGDAYPIGLFFSMLDDRPSQNVVYRYAAAGNGTANGQLGGIVDIGAELIVPFITNLSVSPDIDAGEWPDIDPAVSDQIGEAAANGSDMGLLRLPKSNDLPDGDAPTVWLDPQLTAGARLVSLKSARYGTGDLTLLIWAESTGGNRDSSSSYFSMVVDPAGGVCLPKTPLDAAHAVTGGDDIVRAPDGRIAWANLAGDGISLVVLTPP